MGSLLSLAKWFIPLLMILGLGAISASSLLEDRVTDLENRVSTIEARMGMVTPTEDFPTPTQEVWQVACYVTLFKVNMRNAPDVRAPLQLVIPANTKISIMQKHPINSREVWAQLDYGGRRGFIALIFNGQYLVKEEKC